MFVSRIIVVSLLLFAFQVRGEIIEADSLEQIQKDFAEKYNKDYYPQNILVVIEIDKVILKSLYPPVNNLNTDFYNKATALFKSIPVSNNPYIDQLMFMEVNPGLINPQLPNFIKELTASGTPSIAINKGLTGNFNNISNLEIWRADYLKKLDIDFTMSFPKNNWIIFNNLPSFQNTYPVFYKGILNSNTTEEAPLLLEFLKQVKFVPQILICISNDQDNLETIEFHIKNSASNIAFLGYHYNDKAEIDEGINEDKFLQLFKNVANKANKVKRNNPIKKAQNKSDKKNPYDKK